MVFRHVRTVTLSGGSRLIVLMSMVGHSATRRLFTLDHVDYYIAWNRIQRIDPVSGRVDLSWSVKGFRGELKVACNDHLLLTLLGTIDEFDADGNWIRVIPAYTSLMNEGFAFRISLLLQDRMYFHSAFHNLLSADHRQALAFEITQIPIFAFDVAAYITAGWPTCKYY